MQEIKFRGKTFGGKWVEGYYVVEKSTGKHKITDGLLDIDEVKAETIGMGTGVLDKDGTEIFEGDVVQNGEGGYFYIVYWWSEDVAAAVPGYFCKAAVMKMTEGFAVQLSSDGKVALRLIHDIHIKGGSINLARAKELDPTVTELTEENAGDLIDKAGGVTLKVRAIAQQPFTDLLNDQKPRVERSGVVTAAYVAKKDGTGTGDNTGGSEQGDDDLEG